MAKEYWRGFRESYDAAKEHSPSKESNPANETIQTVSEAVRDSVDDWCNQVESKDYQDGYKAGRDSARYGK